MKPMTLASLALWLCSNAIVGAASLDLSTARLTIDERAASGLTFADGTRWPSTGQPVFAIEAGGKTYQPRSIDVHGDRWTVRFTNDTTAEFHVTCGRGFTMFRLVKLTPRDGVTRLQLFSLATPPDAHTASTVNAAAADGHFAAVMAAEPNVNAESDRLDARRADRAGCHHEFVSCEESKAGHHAARFTATCNEQPSGWSMQGRAFPATLDLTGCTAIRAWVRGDGNGQALKIQLCDDAGGCRDNYLAIDFKGWRQVTLTQCPINTLHYDRVNAINFYYNGMPAGKTVACRIAYVEAVVAQGGKVRAELLEDFDAADSPLWASPAALLRVSTFSKHGIEPAAFGVIACPEAEALDTIERFELAAGLPHPRPGGVWSKKSPWIKQSYFFLTDFRESQFDEALALARRGGFHTILLGQESWSLGTGHYQINRDRFPDGLDGLKRTCERFRSAGFRVGLHFLGASIYPPDPYLTPTPDRRLVTGVAGTLSTDIDDKAAFVPLDATPEKFPAEDGGYMGVGTVLRVGDELISYGKRSLTAPFGLAECHRGHLGTRPTAHKKGDRVAHLVRSYGYHMYDMDTSLLDEVAGHFTAVANACGIDMIYFDGSEALQGDHWYYNARLHKGFYDKLQNKNIFLQASSFSHYSWHLMSREASADGHGDLKGYLDERSCGFDALHHDMMPLDIGWYYGYDVNSTSDQYEYILGATIGYDSSMSYQVSCAAAAAHPFTGEVFDMIARYERLRLSGRVPESMRQRLRIDPALATTPEKQVKLLDRRREYRLVGPEEREYFQRVVYEPWHELKPTATKQAPWTVRVREPQTRVGVQIHAQTGPGLEGRTVRDPFVEVDGNRWQWKGELHAGQYVLFWPDERVTRYGLPLKQPERLSERAASTILPVGEHEVQFGCRGAQQVPMRVRVTLQPSERHEVSSPSKKG
jgi:hypothetical protein